MAPEQTGRMNRSIDSRSDLYALGVTLYEMLTGTLPFMAPDPMELGRSTRTALEHSEHLGWAEIRHPFHPLHGQRFAVLKKRRIAGNDTLILRGLDCGTFSVAREWTDWADLLPADSLKLPLRQLDADSLLALVTLLEQITQRSTEKS